MTVQQAKSIYCEKINLIGDWLCVEERDYKWLALILGAALAIRTAWTLVIPAKAGIQGLGVV